MVQERQYHLTSPRHGCTLSRTVHGRKRRSFLSSLVSTFPFSPHLPHSKDVGTDERFPLRSVAQVVGIPIAEATETACDRRRSFRPLPVETGQVPTASLRPLLVTHGPTGDPDPDLGCPRRPPSPPNPSPFPILISRYVGKEPMTTVDHR